MGNVLTYLQVTGSKYTYYDGNNPKISPLATKDSLLHYDRKKGAGGYSILGLSMDDYQLFFQHWTAFNPESFMYNYLPINSQLELDDPIGADAQNKPKYNSITGNRYQDQKFK
jgi:hypothetical protein